VVYPDLPQAPEATTTDSCLVAVSTESWLRAMSPAVVVAQTVTPLRSLLKVNLLNSPLNLQFLLLKNNLLCGMMSLQLV
jgi:hypothetical protein